MGFIRRCYLAAAVLAIVSAPAAAAQSNDGLDDCLAQAALQTPGQLLSWKAVRGANPQYIIQIVAKDGKVMQTTCSAQSHAVSQPKEGFGKQDYDKLAGRASIPEKQARELVNQYYPGRIDELQLELTWRGGALYTYQLITSDDRAAVVSVDPNSARIVSTTSEAR